MGLPRNSKRVNMEGLDAIRVYQIGGAADSDPSATRDPASFLNTTSVYAFTAIYLLFALYLVWKIRYALTVRRKNPTSMIVGAAFTTLFLLVAACVCQTTWLNFYDRAIRLSDRSDDVGTAVFFTLARVFTFCVCTAMLYVWLSIVTMQVQSVPAEKRMRMIALVSAAVVTLVGFSSTIGLLLVPPDSPAFVFYSALGNICLGFANLIVLVGFAISGSLLIRKATQAAKDANNRTPIKKTTRRIRRLTIVFSVTFFFQTIIAFLVLSGDFFASKFLYFASIYLCFDLIAIFTVASICASIFTANDDEKNSSSSVTRKSLSNSKALKSSPRTSLPSQGQMTNGGAEGV